MRGAPCLPPPLALGCCGSDRLRTSGDSPPVSSQPFINRSVCIETARNQVICFRLSRGSKDLLDEPESRRATNEELFDPAMMARHCRQATFLESEGAGRAPRKAIRSPCRQFVMQVLVENLCNCSRRGHPGIAGHRVFERHAGNDRGSVPRLRINR